MKRLVWSAEFDWLGGFQGLAYVDGLDRSEVLGVCSARKFSGSMTNQATLGVVLRVVHLAWWLWSVLKTEMSGPEKPRD